MKYNPEVSRRTFLAGAVGVGAAALSSSLPRPARADGGEILLLTWETYQDDPWLAEYATKTGVKVTAVRAGSIDEMYAQVQSGAIAPDVIYFDTGTAHRFKNAKLIVPFDASQVANKTDVSPSMDWQHKCMIDGALFGGIPYNWGTQPLMYSRDAVEAEPQSWDALWDPKYKGKVNLFDDGYVTMQMIALAAGAHDPFNLTDAEFDACAKKLKELRPQVGTISKGFDDAQAIYAAGDAVIGYCQNIAVVSNLKGLGKNFAYTFPKEGTPTWIDCSVVTERGNRKEVYDFINESLSKPWQARFITASSNNGILTADDAKAAGVAADVLAKTNIIDQSTAGFWEKMVVMKLPENIDRRIAMWNDFKAGTL